MITFGYIVGGDQSHYTNLFMSLKSLRERIKIPYKVVIIDNDQKLKSTDFNSGISIIHLSNPPKKHYYWSNRYHLHKYMDTDYGMYMDTDTVICNDRIEEIINKSEDKFYICQHWWVNNYGNYLTHNPTQIDVVNKFNTPLDKPYFASGVFLWNNNTCTNVFEEYWNVFNVCYSENDEYKTGITDEFMLCHALNKTNNFKFAHGSLNHCCEKQLMPINLKDNVLVGKNPFEEEFEPIICLHCDLHRRNPSDGYTITMANYIKKMFYLTNK